MIPSLAGEHEGRHLAKHFERLIELARIGPGRLVLDGQVRHVLGVQVEVTPKCGGREPGANSLFTAENGRSPRRRRGLR